MFLVALLRDFAWRWAFLALSGLSAAWILPGTWRPLREAPAAAHIEPPAELASAPGAPGPAVGMSLAAAMATLPFWVLAGATFPGNLRSQTLHVHQAAFLADHDATPMVAASVVSVAGGSSIIRKTGAGWLSDRFPREAVYVLGMASMVAGIGVVLGMAASPTPWLPYAYAVLFGAGYSVTASLMPAMVSDRFQGRHFGSIFGVTKIGGGPPAARSGPGRRGISSTSRAATSWPSPSPAPPPWSPPRRVGRATAPAPASLAGCEKTCGLLKKV